MNPEIFNIKVIVNDENFKPGTHIYYEKRFNSNNIEVAEYYFNHQLETFFTTKRLPRLKIIKGYTGDQKLFSTEIIIFNDGKPFYLKQWIAAKDEKDHHYEGYIK